jgi:hypothetical protein
MKMLNALDSPHRDGFDVDADPRSWSPAIRPLQPVKENAQDEYYCIPDSPSSGGSALVGISQVAHAREIRPLGMRALQLPDTAVKSYFLDAFGRPPRAQTRESEHVRANNYAGASHHQRRYPQ